MLSSGPAWLAIVLLVVVSLLPDVLKKVLCQQLWPSATEKVQVPPRAPSLERGAGKVWVWKCGQSTVTNEFHDDTWFYT